MLKFLNNQNDMNIQPIPYGLLKNAIRIELHWLAKEFFSETISLNIELFDEENNLLPEPIIKTMTISEYSAYGSTKEERALAIVEEIGFVVIPPQIF